MAANHKDVELERGSLSICSFYRFAVCQKAKCEHLHICPAYVAGFCQFQGSCRLSHSLLDFHNQQILKKVNSHLSRINCAENLRMIINGIFPKVCFKYNSVNGCRDERCRFLHVCGMMVNGNCKNANRCPLNHSHVSDHEKHLLNKYKINSHQERNFKKLYANVLYAEGKISSRVQRCVCEGYHLFRADSELSLPISEGDSLLTDICGNEKMHRGGKMTGRGRGSQGFRGRGGNKLPTINPRSLLYNDSNSDDDIYSDWKFPDTGNKAKENDMAIDILRDVLLKNGGKMTFKDLAQCDEVTSTFPKHLQLKNFLIKNRNNLILTYKADERIEEVSWLLKVKICYHYNTHDGCYRKETCDQIHVCKGYIEQSCKGCQKAHHFHEKATLRIFQKVLGINLLKTELMRSAVAASLPKICTNWFRNGGRCDRGNFCSDFHLCQNQLMGRCHVKSCRLNHDIQSCIKKLQTYGIHKNEMKNLQSTILLVPNITEETADKTEVTLNELVRQCLLANGGIISFDALIADRQFMSLFPDGYSQLLEWLKENNHEFLCHYDEWNHVHEVQCLLNLRICHQYNSDSGCRSRDDCKYVHICKGYIAGICKSCPLAHSFGESNTLALLKSRNIPLYKKEVLRGIIFHSLPQICESYALSKNGSCSKKPSCRKLHMCPDALFRSCKNPKCRLTHDRNAPSVMKILKQYNLQACPIGSLSVIILPPAIPKGHGFRCDPKPPELQKARAEYIPGKGKQAKEKRISVKRKNLQRKKPSISTEVNSKAMVELESVNDNSACVPELCEAFIRGICPKQICPFVHKKLPYQWQFEKKGMWCDFSDDMNVDIERRYSDPDYTSWVKEDNQSTALLRKDLLFKGTMMLQFKAEQIVYEDGVSNVRRLSTLSNASADDSQLFATEWCWFYCKDGEWKGREFISDEENDIMLQVELAYLDGKEEFKFTDGENNAVLLKLQEMKAIDSFTGEELLLQRRPTFVDEEIKEKRIRMISSYTMLPTSSMNENPSPSNVLARFDENYMAVKQMMDMSLPSKIISIHMVEKVVNEMGEKTYNERKKCMDFSGGVFQEKIYFYSCDPDMVDYVKKHGPIVNNSLKERGIDLPELGDEGFYFTRYPIPVEYKLFDKDCYVVFICHVLSSNIKTGSYTNDPFDHAVYDTYSSFDNQVIMKMDQDQSKINYLVSYSMSDKPDSLSNPTLISRDYSPPPAYSEIQQTTFSDHANFGLQSPPYQDPSSIGLQSYTAAFPPNYQIKSEFKQNASSSAGTRKAHSPISPSESMSTYHQRPKQELPIQQNQPVIRRKSSTSSDTRKQTYQRICSSPNAPSPVYPETDSSHAIRLSEPQFPLGMPESPISTNRLVNIPSAGAQVTREPPMSSATRRSSFSQCVRPKQIPQNQEKQSVRQKIAVPSPVYQPPISYKLPYGASTYTSPPRSDNKACIMQ